MKRTELMAAVQARITAVKAALKVIPDENAIDAIVLFPSWRAGETYTADDRLQYGGKLYRVIQAHTSQADWTPDAVPALYTEVAAPGEIPVWKQPTGAQDAYAKGDRVHWPGASDPVYESTLDSNVWAPNVYGWIVI